MQFPATLVQLAEKPPSPLAAGQWNFLDWIYPFHAISSNFSSAARKAPCPSQWPVTRQWMFFRLNLLISCNFQQLWFSWQKSPHPQWPDNEIFLDWNYPFHTISSNFGSAGREVLPSAARQWDIFRLNLSISCNFQQLWFSWQKAPPNCQHPDSPPSDQTIKNFRLDLSISCNFQQLWFSW